MLVAAALISSAPFAQAAEPDLGLWFQKLVDTQTRMTAYITRLDSLRDAIEVRGASPAVACDPARMRDLYEPINEEIARLVADAGPLQLEQDAMTALSRLQENWITLQRRQFSRWEEVSEIKNIDLKLLCLQGGDLIQVRMEMGDDQATLAKAVARRLVEK
ncbi:hypothetical protein [Steroidobacter cummioxidans]|uniref:hypothetical protein n=1 Tax=Steroidobacter cummioxidans TaxID=1803913 RepID=UPI00128FCD79|nr:hypothetical protein [Steroidobacter cummioxidans]